MAQPLEPTKPPLVKAGTPNDGLPPNWTPIEEPPIVVGQRYAGPESAPSAGPPGPGQFFAASIPMAMQLQPDIVLARYPGSLGAYRIMPPGPAGNAANNAAAQSATGSTAK